MACVSPFLSIETEESCRKPRRSLFLHWTRGLIKKVQRLSFRKTLQKYSKKKKPQKIVTPLLLMLLLCYQRATGVLLVVVFSEPIVPERQGKNSVQFIVHNTGIIVRVDVPVTLPLAHGLN